MSKESKAPIETIEKSLAGVRLMSSMLFSVAVKYYEKHYYEDIQLDDMTRKASLKGSNLDRNKYRKQLREISKESEAKYREATELIKRVKRMVTTLNDVDQTTIESFKKKTAFIELMTSQSINMQNYSEVLMLIEMYQQGSFKEMFDSIDKKRSEEESVSTYAKEEGKEVPVVKLK